MERLRLAEPSFRALSGRLRFTVRRHKFNKDSLSYASDRSEKHASSGGSYSGYEPTRTGAPRSSENAPSCMAGGLQPAVAAVLERLLQVGHVRQRHCVRPHPQPDTLNPTPSILHPQPCTLNPRPSTLNPTTSRPRHLAQPQRLIQTNCILRRRFPFIQQHTIGIQFSEVHAMDHSTVSPAWWAWAPPSQKLSEYRTASMPTRSRATCASRACTRGTLRTTPPPGPAPKADSNQSCFAQKVSINTTTNHK